MKLLKLAPFLIFIVVSNYIYAQETLPVYSDYLSDNIYLIHPAAAGIGNCAKFRLTHRQQWAGIKDAPSLQTISYHSRTSGDSNIGYGGIIFNDRNGYHSQIGAQGTFAYHIDMGEKFNRLSFALSAMYVANKIDETDLLSEGEFDPVISSLVKSDSYFNTDFGMAYHYKTGFLYFTAKNLLLSARNEEDKTFDSLNIRRYLLNFGYFFDNNSDGKLKWEPSIMGQYIDRTQEIFIDFNIKAYRKLNSNNILWAAISYRNSFDGNSIQEHTQISPIIGVNLKNILISYTYTQQLGSFSLNSGLHQFTVGIDAFCRSQRIAASPDINNAFWHFKN